MPPCGGKTLIGAGAKIGFESPATLVDCQLGPEVELKAVFHPVRLPGTLLHGIGAQVRNAASSRKRPRAPTRWPEADDPLPLRHPGSLINFCDCLMAGGTSRKDHSEVGSSYIHFNFTPNQDKATASLIGDVPGASCFARPDLPGWPGRARGPVRLATAR